MSWRVVIIENGEYLRLRLDNLLVKKGKEEYTIPLDDISLILIENLDAILTTRLLDACTQNNIVVVTCDYKHQPIGIYYGLNTHSRASKILRQQIDWTKKFKDITWTEIVKYKILNQRDLLIKYELEIESINLISEYLANIDIGDYSNREGHSAKVYFNTLFGSDFTRQNDDFINACLNYLYSIVRAMFTRLIVAYGFSGMIGVHHKSEYNNFALVDDLMEPFRPFCDDYILSITTSDSIFDLDMRVMLVDFLNKKIVYKNQKVMVANVIDKYIHSFIRYCKNNEVEKIDFPLISENG
ncbi:CRISPR-associated protein Cas1 [Bacilli bacterium PM5-3]|nr:CRISPR-associated protein Cas1 [Bacilli bacterium PM5-3]